MFFFIHSKCRPIIYELKARQSVKYLIRPSIHIPSPFVLEPVPAVSSYGPTLTPTDPHTHAVEKTPIQFTEIAKSKYKDKMNNDVYICNSYVKSCKIRIEHGTYGNSIQQSKL